MDKDTQGQSRGMQTFWICLTIGFFGFIGIGMSMADEAECKGFMGAKDSECVVERGLRAADRLMAIPIR